MPFYSPSPPPSFLLPPQLLIVHANGWHAIPAPETFSRHSGTCIILGDRNNTGLPFPVKLGDCFRLGRYGRHGTIT